PVRLLRAFRLKDGRSRGQGLCEFESSIAAAKAVRILEGCFLADPSGEGDSRELFLKIHPGSAAVAPKAPKAPRKTPKVRAVPSTPPRQRERQRSTSGSDEEVERPQRYRMDSQREANIVASPEPEESLPPGDCAVFFRSAPRDCDRLLLWRFFSQVGKVRRLKRFISRGGIFRGMGICEYDTAQQAEAALLRLEGRSHDPVLGPRSARLLLQRHVGPAASLSKVNALPGGSSREQPLKTEVVHEVAADRQDRAHRRRMREGDAEGSALSAVNPLLKAEPMTPPCKDVSPEFSDEGPRPQASRALPAGSRLRAWTDAEDER
ncbi:unnamed protein product, partial [Polarella glacialis]